MDKKIERTKRCVHKIFRKCCDVQQTESYNDIVNIISEYTYEWPFLPGDMLVNDKLLSSDRNVLNWVSRDVFVVLRVTPKFVYIIDLRTRRIKQKKIHRCCCFYILLAVSGKICRFIKKPKEIALREILNIYPWSLTVLGVIEKNYFSIKRLLKKNKHVSVDYDDLILFEYIEL